MEEKQAIASIEMLRGQITGQVVTPEDADYDKVRRSWNFAVDHHPALVIIANNAQDVVAAVGFARENGLGIAVQATGHGQKDAADGNMLIVTSRMTAVQVNPEARTARAEGGAVWKDVLEKVTPLGLAPLLGSSPHVGVVGYTLGGGIGWLARPYGLAADSVRSIDIVTPDGVLRHASSTENSDLFWGLLGGSGNFGVVTAIEFALYPVAKIYGGFLSYPGKLATEALRFYRDWLKTVPDELTSSIAVIKVPSLPQIPEAMRGTIQVIMRAVYVGDAAEGAAWIQKWLDWQTPGSNSFHEMPFAEIGTVSNDPVDPTAAMNSNEMLDDLSDAAIDIIIGHATDSASPLFVSELRHAGGAIARVAADANAIGNREAAFYLTTVGMTPNAGAKAAVVAYAKQYMDHLRPFLRGGVYLNFVSGKEAHNRVKDAYRPEAYQRLLKLKAKYDPDNLFRFSFPLVEVK